MIQTEHLSLRQFNFDDKESVISLLKDADFMAFSPTGAMSQEQAPVKFDPWLNAFEKHGVGKFVVIERSSGDLIGYCGIASFEYQNKNEVELGYRLKLAARGKGYAVEASVAALDFAKELGWQRVLALTEIDNAPSQHILFKLGFKACEQGEYKGMPVQFFKKQL